MLRRLLVVATIGDRIETTAVTDPAEAELVQTVDFETFYRMNHRVILRTALALTRDLAAAEDLTQDAFMAARKSWARVGGYERPDLWVRRVVLNLSASRLRRAGREAKAMLRLRHRATSHAELVTPDPELWEAIAALSNRQAQVIVLAAVEDLPVADIAEILDCGAESVRTHLRRARTRLAELLHEET